MLTIINEQLSLPIVNETTNFIKNGRFFKNDRFRKKMSCNFFNVVLHEVKKLWGS